MELQDLRTQFTPFEQYLQGIHDSISNGHDPTRIPGYRDTFYDMESIVEYFAIPEMSPEQKYMGQLLHPDPELEGQHVTPLAQQVECKARTMLTAVGRTGLEQIVAYSTETLAIVAEDPEGPTINGMQRGDLEYIPLETYDRLFETFKTMEELGLTVHYDYQDSIVMPYIDPDNSMHVPDFVVTRYRRDSRSTTQMQHALSLGHEMVGVYLPEQGASKEAMRYYVAVDRYLGRTAGLELMDSWLRRGYAIPPVDFDIT